MATSKLKRSESVIATGDESSTLIASAVDICCLHSTTPATEVAKPIKRDK